jgi:hypothetical protein
MVEEGQSVSKKVEETMNYNDLLLEYRVTKMFRLEADSIGMSSASYNLIQREQALHDALKKLDKTFAG